MAAEATTIAVEGADEGEEEVAEEDEEEVAVEEVAHGKTDGTTHAQRSPARTKLSKNTMTDKRSFRMRKRGPSSGRQ